MELRIDLNEPRILHKVKNDRLGLFVSAEWYKLITPYTPRDTGELMGIIGRPVEVKPWQLHYHAKHSSTVYYNSRGVTFITRGQGRNPYATDHWDEKAAQAGQLDKLYRAINTAQQSGRF